MKHTFIVVFTADPRKDLAPQGPTSWPVDEIELGLSNGLGELGWGDVDAAATVSKIPHDSAIGLIEHLMQLIEKAALDKLAAAP